MSVVLPSQARHSGADSRAGGFAGYFSSVGQPEEFAAAALNLGSNQTAARLTIAPQLAIATWTGFARDPDVATVGPVTCCLSGSPRMAGISNDAAGVDRLARAVAEAYLRHGLAQTLAALRGAFAVVLADRSAQQIAFAVDRLGIERLCYAPCTDGVAFGHSIAAVTDNAHVTPHVSRQSILDYLYFHAIPSPRTIFREVLKVEPATAVVCKAGMYSSLTYWNPDFDATVRSDAENEAALIPTLEAALRRQCGPRWATFLSGGIDSSTIAGLLRRCQGQTASAFTVGFDEPGYDEQAFAQITARHFGLHLRPHVMSAPDVSPLLQTIVASVEEPFGNSSIIPSYVCARTAKEAGFEGLLAGDGGDELFGGNTRYGTQNVFELYGRVPGFVRRPLTAIVAALGPVAALPGVSKVASYVRQATIPLPARLQRYNYLERAGYAKILAPAFLRAVDISLPLKDLQRRYQACESTSVVNRMLYLDWKFTLADNDLRKVGWACELAGMRVAYPWLDDEVIDLSVQVSGEQKVRGRQLRVMARRALAGFLAPETLAKKKHGFGLPFGLWMKRDPGLRGTIATALDMLKSRAIVNPEYIDELVRLHQHEHAAYYGEFIWVLACLELWLQSSRYALEGL